jgi:hypothetical protein
VTRAVRPVRGPSDWFAMVEDRKPGHTTRL